MGSLGKVRAIATVSLFGACALCSSCASPTHVFAVRNTCEQVVAVSVESAAANSVSGGSIHQLAPDGVAVFRVDGNVSELAFVVLSELATGSPGLSDVEFDIDDVEKDAEGVYQLIVGPSCEAVAPATSG